MQIAPAAPAVLLAGCQDRRPAGGRGRFRGKPRPSRPTRPSRLSQMTVRGCGGTTAGRAGRAGRSLCDPEPLTSRSTRWPRHAGRAPSAPPASRESFLPQSRVPRPSRPTPRIRRERPAVGGRGSAHCLPRPCHQRVLVVARRSCLGASRWSAALLPKRQRGRAAPMATWRARCAAWRYSCSRLSAAVCAAERGTGRPFGTRVGASGACPGRRAGLQVSDQGSSNPMSCVTSDAVDVIYGATSRAANGSVTAAGYIHHAIRPTAPSPQLRSRRPLASSPGALMCSLPS